MTKLRRARPIKLRRDLNQEVHAKARVVEKKPVRYRDDGTPICDHDRIHFDGHCVRCRRFVAPAPLHVCKKGFLDDPDAECDCPACTSPKCDHDFLMEVSLARETAIRRCRLCGYAEREVEIRGGAGHRWVPVDNVNNSHGSLDIPSRTFTISGLKPQNSSAVQLRSWLEDRGLIDDDATYTRAELINLVEQAIDEMEANPDDGETYDDF